MQLAFLMIFIVAFLFIFAYLILVKQYYGLISGYWNKSEEEKKRLYELGYPQKMGKIILNSGIILLVGVILVFLGVAYAVEISLVIMLIYTFAHLLIANKLETGKDRKRNFYILIGSIVVLVGIFAVFLIPTNVKFHEDYLEVTGLYGVEWSYDDIHTIDKTDELPLIQVRTNGMSVLERRLGHYRLEGLGGGRLFIQSGEGPYIFIMTDQEYLFLNAKNPEETEAWFAELERAWAE
ncbi:DUF3784 domain-containing protein [Alkalihalobacillus pseudalcaliphilus]|uniref:DUF3784 domain-containing protein n=1 Tax=Alkalihalobacillus pseudalcaliphilus TaxID=79884 RepID=UPI00064DA10A|nr:DUF3784 domain-containing protein [Alkalihalobacillus pseudalcaliphilus]KMK75498.1 hypothetical protein AB990_09360 [Alkalihalobacillus pseudalcaliphilus]